MDFDELLRSLAADAVHLRRNGNDIEAGVTTGKSLDSALIEGLRNYKNRLLNSLGAFSGWWSSPYCITPEMLPLVDLSSDEIASIVGHIPGWAANIQDIYPLAPLQEGILFHHLMSEDGDPYLLVNLLSFDSRARLEAYIAAMQAVIDRHDILRTAIIWDELTEPVQVVLKHAPLRIQEIDLDPAAGDIGTQLRSRFGPSKHRIDIRRAPLIELHIAEDSAKKQFVAIFLFHLLAGDHTTLEVMQEEIQAYLLGKSDGLPSPVPFRNFIAQSRFGLSTEDHENFFRQMLGDVDQPTAPFGLTDVRGDGTEINQGHLMLSPELSRRIRGQARRLGVSAATLCHVAWAQVLARTSARQEVVFGTVLFGRMHGEAGAGRAMGLFINTLPIRISVSQDGAEAAVRNTHRQLAALLEHEHATLALAQRCSAVPAPAPLFSSLLNYRYAPDAAQRNSPEATQAWQGIDWLYGEERTNYPVTLSIDDLGEGFALTEQVDSSIEPLRICEFMRTALESLVDALEHEPLRPLFSLEVLPASERRQVVEEWNDTAVSFPGNECIHELFEQQVVKTPAATALVFRNISISYEELNRRANRLAHHLCSLGVVPDSRVAICVERGPEMIVALLAVLKAGGAYVPLDPAYPVERLLYMLEDSSPVALLTQSHLRNLLPQQFSFPVLELDTPNPVWNPASDSNPDRASIGLTPLHLAYIIYTSGSTGNPKGVMVPHRGLCNTISAMKEVLAVGASDSVALLTTLAFDIAALEIYLPLIVGAQLVVFVGDVRRNLDQISDQLIRRAVTVMQATPSTWKLMLGTGNAAALPAKMICGGEALELELANKLLSLGPELWNMYGPTETTIWSSTAHLPTPIGCTSIGRPIANTQIYILDSQGQPVPIGVSGEIHIGGAGVARGYLNRPELTAERFIPNPFVQNPGARMYRTGDLGRWLPDGNIEFLGRNDFQVKIRGFRIELGEIEARLAEVDGIRDAVVIAREDTPGDKRLVAYYTSAPGADLRAEQMRAHLSATLPEYMVPAAFVALESLPLTLNGKLDRKALPSPDLDAYATAGYEEPRGDIEIALAQIWADILKVERVGRNDNFFDLGGHSLLAVKLVVRIRQALKLDVAFQDLFLYPSVAALAGHLEKAVASELSPILPADREKPIPLSFAQQRLWFLSQIEGVSEAYHVSWGAHLKGSLDRRSLRRALDYIVARHEALRTTFAVSDGEPIQRIAPVLNSSFHLLETDLGSHSGQEHTLHALITREAHASFDLERGPLIRGHLVQTAEDDHVLLITMHHIVSDGWSMGIFSEELSALYSAFLSEDSPSLPDLGIQYADYAVWQRERMQGEILQKQAAYWKSALAGIPSLLELPLDHPRPLQQSVLGASEDLVLNQQLTADLRALSRRHGTTLYMTLLAAWTALLSKLSGQTDIVTGTPSAGRGRSEIDNLIGFFVNALAIRIDLSDSPSIAALLARTKERFLLSQQHQEIPFEQVVELAQPVRSLSHSPVFQVVFAWHNTSDASLILPGLEILPIWGAASQTAKVDLTLSLLDAGDTILGGFEYATALFEQATIRRFIEYFRTLLTAMVLDDTQSVSQIPILPASERRQVVEEWNDTAVSFPGNECIHELFEQQVVKTPAATALVFRNISISYEELNRRANRLAHHLCSLGVVPDSRVAICVERGPEMIVALLAVLKAGGAYVPLDPAYPVERLLYMLEDSSPVALLTQSHLRDLLPQQFSFPVLELDTPNPVWHSASDSNPDRASIGLTPLHLAYIIYTSGSTGSPKGVMVPHRGLCNMITAQVEKFGIHSRSRILQFASFSFDASISETWTALIQGAALCLPGSSDKLVGHDLADILTHFAVTHATLPPSILASVPEDANLSSLETLIVAGEALSASLAQVWLQDHRLINAYGPTEATVCASLYLCSPETRTAPPIGRPIANAQIYILDSQGQPAPIGVSGEIHIGGAGVARGYLNRPELTAERFIPNPFVQDPDARMYRTGDLGRWLPDGNIEFLGRNDFQVKIRGFRIELGEIEARLAEVDGIRDAVVIAREDTPGDKRLVAYYTSAPGADLRAEQMRAHLSATLPEYMVPAAFVALESLPLTLNGKLDRKALPSPDLDAYATAGYEEPRGDIEIALAQIWAEALDLERVGRNDNFFTLGGHSLLAITLIERIRERDLLLDVSTFFTAPTLAALAGLVEETEEIRL